MKHCGSHGVILRDKNPINQIKMVLGIMQLRYFTHDNRDEHIFSNMQPYTKEMIEKFGYRTSTWLDRVIIEGATKQDSLTDEERTFYKGFLPAKDVIEMSNLKDFYLDISVLSTFKERMNKDYIIIYKSALAKFEQSLSAIKKLGADITSYKDTNGNEVLFIDLRNFRADRESILDENLIKEYLPEVEVIDNQGVEPIKEKQSKDR